MINKLQGAYYWKVVAPNSALLSNGRLYGVQVSQAVIVSLQVVGGLHLIYDNIGLERECI